jgi:hypothetical protein
MENTSTNQINIEETKHDAQNEGEEVEMTYEEFLVYSARIGELDDVKFCIDEKVELSTVDDSGNTALRKDDF